MKKIAMMIAAISTLVGGCGKLVEIPAAHKGKVFTSAGFQQGILQPSSIRLPYEFGRDPKLVIVEVSDQGIEEKMSVFMPEDQLNLAFDVRGTFSISDDPDKLNIIFDRLPAADIGESVRRITFSNVYNTYAVHVIRTRSREVLTRYRIEYVLKNVDIVSNAILENVRKDLSNSPIVVRNLAIAALQPPLIIVEAQENAKAREIAIQKAEADKLVRLKEAEASLEVAKKQQQVELTEAETQVLVDKKLAEGVSEAWLRQRGLAVLEKLAAGDNKIIVVPMEALQNPGIMMGIMNHNKEINKEKK